jgi:acyl-CoA thioesterase-1
MQLGPIQDNGALPRKDARSSTPLLLLCSLALSLGCDGRVSDAKTRPAVAVQSDVSALQKAPKVVFLGDGISAGYGLADEEPYPALLERSLLKSETPFRLINESASGETSAGGLRRVDWILKEVPDIVIIELGANDGLRGLSLADLEDNLRQIIAKLRAASVQPVLLGMRLPPSYGGEYARNFDAIYPRLAEELKLPFVPFFMSDVAGVDRLNQQDGIHPTKEGHERLARNVRSVLVHVLKDLDKKKPPRK